MSKFEREPKKKSWKKNQIKNESFKFNKSMLKHAILLVVLFDFYRFENFCLILQALK